MKERTLLPAAVVGLLLLWIGTLGLWAVEAQMTDDDTGPRVAGSETSIEWKLVTTWPKGLPGLGSAPENFARRVGEMSNGRLTVRVYGAGEVVPPFEVFDAVSQGVAEMGHGASYYWKGKIPSSVFYTAVPFGMTAQEMNGWLHYGGGLELWRELYAPFGVRPFAGGSTGVQMAGWFNRELKSASDLDGLKMRIPGLAGEVFAASGGTAVRLAGGEIYTSMQTGVIDAVEWVGPYNDRTLGLMEVAEYYYYPGWHEPGAMLEFTVNQAAFDRLPADLQAIVEGAARATNQDMLDEFTARNNESLTTLLEEHSTKLRPLPDDVMDVLHSNAVIALEQLKKDDPMAQKISASYEAFLDGVRTYHEISERAYLNARDRVLPPITFTDQ
ncbi:MAG: TRAP transporter substrate-binding protein DctP [Halieaceae bacterium]|jgi:TRAP-type mannitol/chloroaromatic compound transport system substrate-binding protein